MLTLLLAALLFFWPQTDAILNRTNHDHVVSCIEALLEADKVPAGADALVAAQRSDGTWADVDYQSKLRGDWGTAGHLYHYRDLASAYHASGDVRYLEAAKKALAWWAEVMPVCPNWWYNEIGCPRAVGPATVMIMESLDSNDIEAAAKILAKASFKQTGQNRIWQAQGVMMRAYLEGDSALVCAARDTIASEIRVTPWKEGIQPDWSFHQHGPQLQWGNYGESYAGTMSFMTVLFDGTPLAFSPEQRRIVEDYISLGPAVTIWNGWFDMSACGRQIVKFSQKTKTRTIVDAMKRLGLEGRDLSGPHWYPYSDFAVYRAEDWYASVRMQSSRTKGMEQTNKENMRGYFAADGALLVRRAGDEYKDVAAVWDWHHVPGATTYDDGSELFGWQNRDRYNKTDLVFGDVNGDCMAVAMDVAIDGMSGRKAWFFTNDCIICLGCGISKEGGDHLVTGVEQCRIKGRIKRRGKAVSHNGISYIPLTGEFATAPLEHSGSWKPVHPKYSDEIETMDLLDLYIDHGNGTSDASYAYVVIPDGSSPGAAVRKARKVKVLSNTTEKQTVQVSGKLVSIDWTAGKVEWK